MYYLTFTIPYQTIPGQSFFVHLFRSLTRVNPLSVALRNLVVEKPLDNGWRTDLDDFYSFNPQRYKIRGQVLTKRGHLMSRSRFVLNYSPGSICIFMLKLFINWKILYAFNHLHCTFWKTVPAYRRNTMILDIGTDALEAEFSGLNLWAGDIMILKFKKDVPSVILGWWYAPLILRIWLFILVSF